MPPQKGDYRDKVVGGGLGVAGAVTQYGQIYDGTQWVDSNATQQRTASLAGMISHPANWSGGPSTASSPSTSGFYQTGTPSPKVWFPVKYGTLTGKEASEAMVADAKLANVPFGRFLRNLPDFQTARQRALDHASAQGHSLTDIEIIVEAGALSYKLKDEPADEAVDFTFTHFKDDAGNVWMYDKDDPNALTNATKIVTAVTTVNVNDPGVEPAGSVTNADKSVTKFYTVTDMKGNTSMKSVTTPAALTKDDVVPIDGGRLIPRGNGTYDYEADPKTPFVTSILDIVPLPDQGGSLIKTSENQYQFVRDTYEPGVVKDPVTGRYFSQSALGTWTELDPDRKSVV